LINGRNCFENASAEGTLECGSVSYRRSLEFQGGSFAAALHDGLRIFMLSGRPQPAGMSDCSEKA